jgi:hypothetical protein
MGAIRFEPLEEKIKRSIIIVSLLVIAALAIPAVSIPIMPVAGNVCSIPHFHMASCRCYDCKACAAEFNTREEAIKAGYRPCKICKP